MFTNERSKRRIPVTHDNFSAKKLSLEEIHVWANPSLYLIYSQLSLRRTPSGPARQTVRLREV